MIYEYSYSILGQNNVQMVMTSVSGHLLNLDFSGSFRGWRSCSPLSLFDAPVQVYCPENYTDIKRTLEKEIRGCQGSTDRVADVVCPFVIGCSLFQLAIKHCCVFYSVRVDN